MSITKKQKDIETHRAIYKRILKNHLSSRILQVARVLKADFEDHLDRPMNVVDREIIIELMEEEWTKE